MSKTQIPNKDRKNPKHGKIVSHGTYRDKRKPNSPRVKSQQKVQ